MGNDFRMKVFAKLLFVAGLLACGVATAAEEGRVSFRGVVLMREVWYNYLGI